MVVLYENNLNTKIMERLRLEGPLEFIWSNPAAQAGPLREGCPEPRSDSPGPGPYNIYKCNHLYNTS